MIIDIHGHCTTAPKALETSRNRQIAAIGQQSSRPKPSELKISDDELRESIETNQLRLMRERGLDLTVFSPRARPHVPRQTSAARCPIRLPRAIPATACRRSLTRPLTYYA